MHDTPALLDITSVDVLISAIREHSDISGGAQAATYHLAHHDFAQHRTLELRILGTYGFGGKLYIELLGGIAVASCSAYREDEAASWFQAGRFARLGETLKTLELGFEQPDDTLGERDAGPIHLVRGAHDTNAEFDLIRCGGGISMPGFPQQHVPTCISCRNARAIGGDLVAIANDMSIVLADLVAKKTFPASRRALAVAQIEMLDAAAINPRAVIGAAVVDGQIKHLRTPVTAPLAELYRAFFTWNVRVLEAHGVRHKVRFPLKKVATELLERCDTALAGDTCNA